MAAGIPATSFRRQAGGSGVAPDPEGAAGVGSPQTPQCQQPCAVLRLTPCRDTGAGKLRPPHLRRVQGPQQAPQTPRSGRRRREWWGPQPHAHAPPKQRPSRPRPSDEEGRRRPAGGRSKRRAVPCRVRERHAPRASPPTRRRGKAWARGRSQALALRYPRS